MKLIKKWFFSYWRAMLGGSLALAALLLMYCLQLNSLTNGFSRLEYSYLQSTESILSVLKEPVFLPHKLLTYGLQALTGAGFVRVSSAVLMMAMVACFYALMNRWYTRRIALLATLLFASSSWTITIARQALPTVLYLGWLPTLALLYWTLSKSKQTLSLLLWSLSIGLAFYVPGILWFVIVLAISQRKRLGHMISNTAPWQVAVSAVLLLLLVTPFIYGTVQNPLFALQSVGIPTSLIQITNFPRRLLQVFMQIFIYSSGNPVFGLGHLPYLDVTTCILFLTGLYRLRYSSARKLMGWSGLITLGWLIGAGFSSVNIAVFLPLIYIFVGGGVSFLLVQWFKVFPKNPIARAVGTLLMTSLVVLISFYHLTRYFVAWPNNPATQAAFSRSGDKIDK